MWREFLRKGGEHLLVKHPRLLGEVPEGLRRKTVDNNDHRVVRPGLCPKKLQRAHQPPEVGLLEEDVEVVNKLNDLTPSPMIALPDLVNHVKMLRAT